MRARTIRRLIPQAFLPDLVMVHFSLPADEVVHGGSDYTPSIRPESDNEHGVKKARPLSLRSFSVQEVHCQRQLLPEPRKRQSEGEATGREPKALVREETPPHSPTKRAAETPAESLDPRVDPT